MAREGIPIIVSLLLATVLAGTGALVTGWLGFDIMLFAGSLLSTFSMYFFRDPEREGSQDPAKLVSPADGRIVAITPVKDDFVGTRATRISIFLTIFDVHVNRAPCMGSVVNSRYRQGKFLAAFNERTSEENEQTIIDFRNKRFKVRIKQIAGLIARRIVNYLKPGDNVQTGDRFGLIRFGSRVDIIIPPEISVTVDLKQKVYAGRTIIGEYHEI